MIVGINMHQASNAVLGHHSAKHNSLNGGTGTSIVGPQSTDRLTYLTDHNNDSTDNYPIHQLHQFQQYDSFNSSSLHVSDHSINVSDGVTANAAHQVYVSDDDQHRRQHTGLLGLEQQFAQFGMQPNQQESSDQPPTANYIDAEGDDADDEPVKLFVGQIPKTMNEEEIFPTFNSFGPLKDVTVIRDKHSNMHRGCAFVTYWSPIDAERARVALHDRLIFPGAKRAAQVKPAEPSGMSSNASSSGGAYGQGQDYRISQEAYIASLDPVDSDNKLFVGMLSRTCDEQEARNLFSRFGEILDVHLIRNADGSSKCAAFLRFERKESALQAIAELNGLEVMDGAQRPLIVKFADTKEQRQRRQIRNVRRHEMVTMVGPGGYPYHPQGLPIPMGAHPSVAAHYSMPPSTGPHNQPFGPGDYGPTTMGPHHYMYPPHYAAPIPQYAYAQPTLHHPRHEPSSRPPASSSSSVSSNNPRPQEGPAGANLFVYHLPHDLTDADLATAFNPFGNVISAKVYVDKFTGESKGFGFVSYDSVLAAEQAIEQMNGFQIGNKRLKVQHKRVHASHGSGGPSSVQIETNSPLSSSGNDSTTVDIQ